MNRDDNRSLRSHNLRPVSHTGLADRKEVEVHVRFPSGETRKYQGVKAGQQIDVHEREP